MNVILMLISKHGFKDCRDRTKGGWDNVIMQVELRKKGEVEILRSRSLQ